MIRFRLYAFGSPVMRIAIATLIWVMSTLAAAAQTGTFIDRQFAADLRMMTYNILWDSIFPDKDATKAAKFSRVINALDPDILNLQEIGDPFTSGWTPKTGSDVRNLLNSIAPLTGGSSWNVYKGNSGDAVLASKYPLSMTRNFTNPGGDLGMAIGLVDLPDDLYPTDFYVMNNHYKCCNSEGNEDARRQRQSDANVSWLRDARTSGGFIDLAPGTPFAVVGDLNIVGSQSPLDTLITGNIVNESTYGLDSPPDWDSTNLTDARPFQNVTGTDTYTYRSGSTRSRLDYIIYSDSNLDVGNSFVLNTYSMSASDRTAAGLQRYDTSQGNSSTYFDHLPVIVDFRIFEFSNGDFNYDRLVDAADLGIWQTNYGLASGATRTSGDANGDGRVDGRDFLVWQEEFAGLAANISAVPEPNGAVLVLIGLVAGLIRRGN